jgi:putative Ca2+/H+ antiporter (TMEM165/GDT1 family)
LGISSRFFNSFLRIMFSKVFIQVLTMTFVAEWGDRSQLVTLALGAREDLSAVILAGLLGHVLCTGLAVLGGRMVAKKISVRTVTLVGGVVYLVFAISSLFVDSHEFVEDSDREH